MWASTTKRKPWTMTKAPKNLYDRLNTASQFQHCSYIWKDHSKHDLGSYERDVGFYVRNENPELWLKHPG